MRLMRLNTDLERTVWAAAYAAAFVQPQHPQTQVSSSIQRADEAVRELRKHERAPLRALNQRKR